MMYSIYVKKEYMSSSATMKNFVLLIEDKVELVNKENEADYIILPISDISDKRFITPQEFMLKLNSGKNRFTLQEKTNIILMTLGNQDDKLLALDLMFSLDFKQEHAFFQLYLVLAARDYNLKNSIKLKLLIGIWQNLRYIEKGSLCIIGPGMIHGKYDLGMYTRLVQSFSAGPYNKRLHSDVLEILSNRSVLDVFLRPYSGYLKFGEITINDLVKR